jgi:hypothetical protein
MVVAGILRWFGRAKPQGTGLSVELSIRHGKSVIVLCSRTIGNSREGDVTIKHHVLGVT